ncbi:unnamed protein product [Diamesa serratosioi]
MEIYIFLCSVGTIYGMLMFFDYFFKSCSMLPYLDLLKNTGITIGFFRITWHTQSFNRTVVKWSTKLPYLYRSSFKLGVYISLLLFPIAMTFVVLSIFTSSSTAMSVTSDGTQQASTSSDVARLQILLPGVNLPINEFGYYVIALLICSVVHELGHGIAAVLEDIPVTGFGLNLVFLIPIAYTEIDTDQISSARLWKKLKVYSAGIWNNIILAAFAYAFLLLTPILLSPIYLTNESVVITSIKYKSPLSGKENGLHVGDVISSINDCTVNNEEDWYKCLTETIVYHPAYCIKEEFVHENDESIQISHQKDGLIDCCQKNAALNCFENYVNNHFDEEDRLPQHMCLNIRNTVENSLGYCHVGDKKCTASSCLKPILSNFSTIIQMKRQENTKDLIYFGHPADVSKTVKISGFVPKTRVLRTSKIGDSITLLLKYLVVFSSGLAIVNVIPCYFLDGQFLINALIIALPARYFNKTKKEFISFSINLLGTIFLFASIFKILWTTFM